MDLRGQLLDKRRVVRLMLRPQALKVHCHAAVWIAPELLIGHCQLAGDLVHRLGTSLGGGQQVPDAVGGVHVHLQL